MATAPRQERVTRFDLGFTLVEMAMVLVIVGIFLAAGIQIYNIYHAQQTLTVTKDNMQAARSEISSFFVIQDRYPCPSDRSLAPGDANFGREFNATCDPAVLPVCTGVEGVCKVAGARDANGINGVADDWVLVGGVPFITMIGTRQMGSISSNLANDGWGDKLTYAVTAALTRQNTYNFSGGAINGTDEFNQMTAGLNNNAHYVLISHGKNRLGAFVADSRVMFAPCNLALLGATPRGDQENCNPDSTFVQGIGFTEAPGPSYYDDIVYFSAANSTLIWRDITLANGASTGNIETRVTGNVGVNLNPMAIPTPRQRLDVANTLRAFNTGTFATATDPGPNGVMTTQICATSGAPCLNINAITGTGTIRCSSSQVMTGIANSTAQCATPSFTGVRLQQRDCSPGVVVGFKTNGEVVCQ